MTALIDKLIVEGFEEEAATGIAAAIVAAGLEWTKNLPILKAVLDATEGLAAEEAAKVFSLEFLHKNLEIEIPKKKGGKKK